MSDFLNSGIAINEMLYFIFERGNKRIDKLYIYTLKVKIFIFTMKEQI